MKVKNRGFWDGFADGWCLANIFLFLIITSPLLIIPKYRKWVAKNLVDWK